MRPGPLKERRAPEQGAVLRQWLETQVLNTFQGRTLPVTLDIARVCAGLHVPDSRPQPDALMAATALVHELTLVTRHTQEFQDRALSLVNPWEE